MPNREKSTRSCQQRSVSQLIMEKLDSLSTVVICRCQPTKEFLIKRAQRAWFLAQTSACYYCRWHLYLLAWRDNEYFTFTIHNDLFLTISSRPKTMQNWQATLMMYLLLGSHALTSRPYQILLLVWKVILEVCIVMKSRMQSITPA
jgi:hypothetical protein